MLTHNVEVDIPYDTVCTLRQACEYIALGWKPTNNEKYEQYLKRYRSRYLYEDPDYAIPVSDAQDLLGVLFEKGDIIMTGIEDPGKPLRPYDDNFLTETYNAEIKQLYAKLGYVPREHTEHVKITKPQKWKFDLDANWVINETDTGPSYRNVQIQMTDLEEALSRKSPTKKYELQWDGETIFLSDGTLSPIPLRKLRGNAKTKPIWEYIMANPDREITRTELLERFDSVDDEDDISLIPRNTIEQKDILNGCFPVLKSDVIKFVPQFTDLNIKRNKKEN